MVFHTKKSIFNPKMLVGQFDPPPPVKIRWDRDYEKTVQFLQKKNFPKCQQHKKKKRIGKDIHACTHASSIRRSLWYFQKSTSSLTPPKPINPIM